MRQNKLQIFLKRANTDTDSSPVVAAAIKSEKGVGPPKVDKPKTKKQGKQRTILLIIVLLLAAGCVVGVWWWKNRQAPVKEDVAPLTSSQSEETATPVDVVSYNLNIQVVDKRKQKTHCQYTL